MLNYVINENTLAIIPYGTKKSIVLDGKTKYMVNRHPNAIMKQNCILYGSTYDGKIRQTELLTGYTYKAPILLNYEKKLLFFPTSSPRLKDCAWINPLKIRNYEFDEDKSQCVIEFFNGKVISVTASLRIIDNQILKSSKLMALSSLNTGFIR